MLGHADQAGVLMEFLQDHRHAELWCTPSEAVVELNIRAPGPRIHHIARGLGRSLVNPLYGRAEGHDARRRSRLEADQHAGALVLDVEANLAWPRRLDGEAREYLVADPDLEVLDWDRDVMAWSVLDPPLPPGLDFWRRMTIANDDVLVGANLRE